MKDIDIEWPLDEMVEIKVIKTPDGKFVIEDTESKMTLTLSWKVMKGTDWDRLLFDGEDIETESYMGYIGLMDAVNEALESKGKSTGTVLMPKKYGEVTVVE